MKKIIERKFVAYWFRVPGFCISFGISIDFISPNIEIHLPFGFFKIGFKALKAPHVSMALTASIKKRTFGYDPEFEIIKKHDRK